MTAELKFEDIDEIFLKVIAEHVAGDPMDEKIKWIKLTRNEIGIAMKEYGVDISRNIVKKLLKKHGFVKRKIQRKKSTGCFKDRDEQFKKIETIKQEFMESENPILSIDTKKKEKIGNLHREGEIYCTQAIESYDHDYAHLSEGTLVPHGIYDMKRNEAMVTLGIGKETAEFICHSIMRWWQRLGKNHYPNAKEILILCDAGGANSYRHHVFKVALQKLANSIGIPIRICHYPPYASKWNPIEHRVFPHISRVMAGVKIESVNEAKELIKRTKTKTGLNVVVEITKRVFKSGIAVAKETLEKLNLIKDEVLGQLNYVLAPMNEAVVMKC